MYTNKKRKCSTTFFIQSKYKNKLLKVTESDILSIIKALDSTKAHGYDKTSIRMIKIYSESITLPLKIIFQESLEKGKFPEIRKKASVVPVIKRKTKLL